MQDTERSNRVVKGNAVSCRRSNREDKQLTSLSSISHLTYVKESVQENDVAEQRPYEDVPQLV